MFCDMTHSTKDRGVLFPTNSNRKKECGVTLTLCWSQDFLIRAPSSPPLLS